MVRNPYREFGLSDEDYIQEKFLKFWMATVFDKRLSECECEVLEEPSKIAFESNREMFLRMMQSGSLRGKLLSGQYIFYNGRICVNDPNLFVFDGESFVLKEGVDIDDVSLFSKKVQISGENLSNPAEEYDVNAFEKGFFRQKYSINYAKCDSEGPGKTGGQDDSWEKLDVHLIINSSGLMSGTKIDHVGHIINDYDSKHGHSHDYYPHGGDGHAHEFYHPEDDKREPGTHDKPEVEKTKEKNVKTYRTSVYECAKYADGINDISKEEFDSYMEDMFGMPRSFSDILKYWIKKKNTTQEALALEAGISPRTLSRMITDEDYQPKLKTVVAVCIALHLFPMISTYIVDRAGLSFKDNIEGYACQLLLNVYYKSSIEECNYFMIRMGASPLSDRKED